jgi:CO/xanthine dehydrogenase FAD-binding subunit
VVAVLLPQSLDDALAALAGDASLEVLAGGTDLLVECTYGERRPERVLSLRRVAELREWRVDGGDVVLGARTTYADLMAPPLADLVPALAQAARTVGSPQIRATGTVGGNLATGSPAGDTLPVLYALDAAVELASVRGRRTLPVQELVVGPKRTALAPGELITTVRVPVAAGPQEFLKIGVRNAMVIAIASCALVVDVAARRLACALGSVGPTVIRDRDAEEWAAGEIDWSSGTGVDVATADAFGDRMRAAASPIDDHRATAEYRRHAVGVLAARGLRRCFP